MPDRTSVITKEYGFGVKVFQKKKYISDHFYTNEEVNIVLKLELASIYFLGIAAMGRETLVARFLSRPSARIAVLL